MSDKCYTIIGQCSRSMLDRENKITLLSSTYCWPVAWSTDLAMANSVFENVTAERDMVVEGLTALAVERADARRKDSQYGRSRNRSTNRTDIVSVSKQEAKYRKLLAEIDARERQLWDDISPEMFDRLFPFGSSLVKVKTVKYDLVAFDEDQKAAATEEVWANRRLKLHRALNNVRNVDFDVWPVLLR